MSFGLAKLEIRFLMCIGCPASCKRQREDSKPRWLLTGFQSSGPESPWGLNPLGARGLLLRLPTRSHGACFAASLKTEGVDCKTLPPRAVIGRLGFPGVGSDGTCAPKETQ